MKLSHQLQLKSLIVSEFIFEETQAQADVLRNVLVIDNLEEKTFIPLKSGAMTSL